MKFLKTFIIDCLIIGLTFYIACYQPEYRWFVNLFLIMACVLATFVNLGVLCSDEVKEEMFKQKDKRTYYSKGWYPYYNYSTDIIMIIILIYFQFKVLTSFYLIYKLFSIWAFEKYKEHLKEEKEEIT